MDAPDYFALLQEPRRPWLDLESVKQRFYELSAPTHPDRVHGASETERKGASERFVALNAAYLCLRDPKERLAHLLALERGGKLEDVQRIPPGTMDLFLEVGQACRELDVFLAERERVSSPMLRLQQFERGLGWTDRFQELERKVAVRRVDLETELRLLNEPWRTAPAPGAPDRATSLPLARLEQLYRIYSYVSRWSQQIQERLARLAV